MRRLRLRSVGARLSAALLLVVAGALAVVYFVVVPSLEDRLTDTRQRQTRNLSRDLASRLPIDQTSWQPFAEQFASTSGNRVVILGIFAETPLTLTVIADAGGGGRDPTEIGGDPIARSAASSRGHAEGVVVRGGVRFVESADYTFAGGIVLVSSSLSDVDAEVDLVRQRVILAGLIALVVALLVG